MYYGEPPTPQCRACNNVIRNPMDPVCGCLDNTYHGSCFIRGIQNEHLTSCVSCGKQYELPIRWKMRVWGFMFSIWWVSLFVLLLITFRTLQTPTTLTVLILALFCSRICGSKLYNAKFPILAFTLMLGWATSTIYFNPFIPVTKPTLPTNGTCQTYIDPWNNGMGWQFICPPLTKETWRYDDRWIYFYKNNTQQFNYLGENDFDGVYKWQQDHPNYQLLTNELDTKDPFMYLLKLGWKVVIVTWIWDDLIDIFEFLWFYGLHRNVRRALLNKPN